MKIILTTVFVFFISFSFAQKKEVYYDYNWKECDVSAARYFSLTEPADSLWKRQDFFIREKKLQMLGFYKDKACKIKNGSFEYYYSNGKLQSAGLYINNKKQGLWLRYHNNGMMSDSTLYENDVPVGTGLSWHSNGLMSDSNVYNAAGKSIRVSWFDNGQPSFAGIILNNKEFGKWRFYHKNGKLSAEEIYENGKLLSRSYYAEDGNSIDDTTNRDREAECTENWQEYLSKNLYFPPNMKIINSDKATVVVSFTVNEDGTIEDAFIYSPIHPLLDEIALNTVKNSPPWKPAIDHNRRIKAYRRQPLTFLQPVTE
ncbi:MAG: TonB family protein [Ferruginibacter sp.]